MQKLDERTYELLFRKYFSEMVLFAMRYLKDMETSKEIVQEVFVIVWEKRREIDPAGNVKSYIANSVRNRSLNYLRDHKKISRDLLEIEENAFRSGEDHSSAIDEKELAEKIEGLVAELPDKCREVFKLSRFESLKYKEIADRMGISVKTVEAQMSKALGHLRENLKDYLMLLVLGILSCLPYLSTDEKTDSKNKEDVDKGKCPGTCIIFEKK